MARTIKEIADGMKADFVRNETLQGLYGLTDYDPDRDTVAQAAYYDSKFSAVSVETCILFVVAACAALVENMFDWFTEDVDETVNNERYGRKGWYEKTAMKFQFTDGTDYELDEDTGDYEVANEEARIVTHASATSSGFGVKLKVAKGDVGALSPLTQDERDSFQTYINRLKPAGVPVTVVSRNADLLAVNMAVYYDPLVFTEATAQQKVKDTITAYLQGMAFDGAFVAMAMIDRLQAVQGLDVIEVRNVRYKHEGYEYREMEYNDSYPYIPDSGYMALGDDEEQEIEMRVKR